MSGQTLATFEWTTDTLTGKLAEMPADIERVVRIVVEANMAVVFERVRSTTPVDTGAARDAWRQEEGAHGGGIAEALITNDRPYINVLEYGGYPVRPVRGSGAPPPGSFRRGNAWLGGMPPGPRTQRAPGGDPPVVDNVSTQAPQGMMRAALAAQADQLEHDLGAEIEAAWYGGT